MLKNSRSHTRKAPAKFGFIQILGDEGGHILNISEAGLCFETFAPIGRPKEIQFWFSLNLRDRIEATGEVAWLDSETRIGGLRFRGLTQRAVKHIRTYSADLPALGNQKKGELFVAALTKQVSGQNAQASDALHTDVSPHFKAEVSNHRANSLFEISANAARPVVPDPVNSTDLISLQRHVALCRRQLILGALLGALFASIAFIPVASYIGYRSRISSSQTSVGSVTRTTADSETTPAQPTSGTPGAYPALNVSAPVNAQQSIAARVPSTNPSKYISPVPSSPFSEGSRKLNDANAAKRSGSTPQQLWSAVQSGDANAAVLLADRYLHGDGVPVNCVQARVLLLVASEKNNANAIKKLHELDKTGCPSS